LLAEHGDDVHVIAPRWAGADHPREEHYRGKLVVHRVPLRKWAARGLVPHAEIESPVLKGLFESGFYPQCFGWQASLLAEKLVAEDGIDVIEAQEFEGPLYFFQLRRALGLGPQRRPPCIVHVHSPTEFIVRHNDWDPFATYFRTAQRLEEYSIRAADALLCPSRFLARQIEQRYGLVPESVETIPLPLGQTAAIERSTEVWETGTVCYAGRLERRKGILEWLEAAVAVAHEDPTVRFEFVGANILSNDEVASKRLLDDRIPRSVRSRFLFRGEQRRATLGAFQARARLAVVPSRWENFPYACIEAMASGLPVIVSPAGGMAEVVEHGRSGWVAASGRAVDLARALRHALATPAARLAGMGRQAAEDASRFCDPERVLEAHLRLRRRVVDQGAKTSLAIPQPSRNSPLQRAQEADGAAGIAIVATSAPLSEATRECVDGIRCQLRPPAAAVLIDRGMADERVRTSLEREKTSWRIISLEDGGDVISIKNASVRELLASGTQPIGFAFLDDAERLSPDFVRIGEEILRRCPEIGLLSFWFVRRPSLRVTTGLNPAFPYQWVVNEACSFSIVRTEALLKAGTLRTGLPRGYERWDLANAVLAAGWLAVTVPEVMGTLAHDPWMSAAGSLDWDHRRAHQQLLARFPDLAARDASDLVGFAAALVGEENQRELAWLWSRYDVYLLRKARGLAGPVKRLLRRAAAAARRSTPS